MDVDAFDENGNSVRNKKAELVCKSPFPSMPVFFWNDDSGDKYRKAYFDKFPSVWAHGDFIEINDRGGLKIFGRSDATLILEASELVQQKYTGSLRPLMRSATAW